MGALWVSEIDGRLTVMTRKTTWRGYETLVLEGDALWRTRRYKTETDALKGHKEIVSSLLRDLGEREESREEAVISPDASASFS